SQGFKYLTLQNGWTNAPLGTTNAQASDIAGIVHLQGAIANGTTPIAFTLPAAFRPPTNIFVPVDLCDATNGRLLIQPSGVVSVEAEGGNSASARHLAPLRNARPNLERLHLARAAERLDERPTRHTQRRREERRRDRASRGCDRHRRHEPRRLHVAARVP